MFKPLMHSVGIPSLAYRNSSEAIRLIRKIAMQWISYLKSSSRLKNVSLRKNELVDVEMVLEISKLFPFQMVWANDAPLSKK